MGSPLPELESWQEFQDSFADDPVMFRFVGPDSGFSDYYQRASTPVAADTDISAALEFSMSSKPPIYGPVPSPLRPSELRELFIQRPEVELPYLPPVYGPVPSPRPLLEDSFDHLHEEMPLCPPNSGDSLGMDVDMRNIQPDHDNQLQGHSGYDSAERAEVTPESTTSQPERPTARRVRRPSLVVLDWQRTILEQHFRERRYCQRSTRDFLATGLGMAPHEIMQWFQNQRRNQTRRERLQGSRNPGLRSRGPRTLTARVPASQTAQSTSSSSDESRRQEQCAHLQDKLFLKAVALERTRQWVERQMPWSQTFTAPAFSATHLVTGPTSSFIPSSAGHAWTSSGTSVFTQAAPVCVTSSGTSLTTSTSATYTMPVSRSSVATRVVYAVCTHQHTVS